MSKRLLFHVPALFSENTREHDFNVEGANPAFGVWHTRVLHASGFSRTRLHVLPRMNRAEVSVAAYAAPASLVPRKF